MAPGSQAQIRSFRLPEPSHDGLEHRLRVPGDWRRPQATGHFDLWWREADGYGAILPRPDVAEIADFYRLDDYYTHHEGKQDGQRREGFLQRILLHLAWRLDKGIDLGEAQLRQGLGDQPLAVLEIGCGGGEILHSLESLGHQVTGLDPDPDALAQAAKLTPGAKLLLGTAEDFPAELQDQRFDAIVMKHVLEHCLDPIKALTNSFAALKPGGRLIIEVPNNECAGLDVFGPAWFWLDVPRHLNFFSSRSLTAMATACGFAVDRTDYTGYARQFTEDWRLTHERIGQSFGRRGLGRLSHGIRLLAKTALARPAKRYDSLRILAHRPAEGG